MSLASGSTLNPAYASDEPVQVVIAGAGLAGSSLALRLAREGIRVALIDAATFPRPKLCGEFLSPETWGVWDDLGLTGAIEESGFEPIRRVRITTPRAREVFADVVGPDGRPGLGLSRSTLDDLLLRAARAAGTHVVEGSRVVGPIVEGGRVVGVLARAGAGEPVAIRAQVTVAADGRQSALVRATGTTRGRSWRRARHFGLKRHLAADTTSGAEEPGTVGLHLVAGGYGGTCRVEDGSTNLCALLPERAVRARRGDLDRVAREVLGRNPVLARLVAGGQPQGDWKAVAGVHVQISRPTLPGILFVGDALGTVDPLGGQGMTMALLGAAEVVPFVKTGLLRWRREITPSMQEAWLDHWHHRFDRRVRLCRGFHHLLTRPGLVDTLGLLGPGASRLLALGYGLTRDSDPTRGRTVLGGVGP